LTCSQISGVRPGGLSRLDQKELVVETGEAPARFFPGLKREALVTIISADMQRYANFACGDAWHVSSMPLTRHVRH
jgi:hypothetical protein